MKSLRMFSVGPLIADEEAITRKGATHIPCHLGLKRLDPSGWQMIDPTATLCLSNGKAQKQP